LFPAAASDLVATTVDSDEISLAWTDNSSNETGFRVERSLDGIGSWSTVATKSPDVTVHTDTGLTPETQYFYRIVAFNLSGDASPSNVDDATTDSIFAPNEWFIVRSGNNFQYSSV